MKIRCDTEVLRKAVQVVRGVVSGKNANLVLNDIMVEATQDSLVLSATDLEVSLQYRINNIVIDEPGVMVCPESKLAPILKDWQAESIGISESKGKCSIRGTDASFMLMCADPEKFPKMPSPAVFAENKAAGVQVEIDRDVLADMLRKVAFIGCDVFLSVGAPTVFSENKDVGVNTQIIMVSNDGRRLAEVVAPVDSSGIKDTGVWECIIPIKTIPQIVNVIKGHEGVVKVKIEKNRIFVQAGNITLCSQLIEGVYPEHEDAIPKDLDKEISAEREAFFSAVRRSAVMTTDDNKLLTFTFTDNRLSLRCESQDVGEAKVDIPVEYEGDKVVIGLNPDYVNDLSKVVDTEKVTMRLKDHTTACVFDIPPVDSEGIKDTGILTYRYVIMPMELEKQVIGDG